VAASRVLRPPLTVTIAVWKALFLREAISRLAQDRIAWALLIVEPLFHVVLLMWVFSIGFRQRVIAGADVGVFIMLGILGYFLVRNIMNSQRIDYYRGYLTQNQHVVLPFNRYEFGEPHLTVGVRGRF